MLVFAAIAMESWLILSYYPFSFLVHGWLDPFLSFWERSYLSPSMSSGITLASQLMLVFASTELCWESYVIFWALPLGFLLDMGPSLLSSFDYDYLSRDSVFLPFAFLIKFCLTTVCYWFWRLIKLTLFWIGCLFWVLTSGDLPVFHSGMIFFW